MIRLPGSNNKSGGINMSNKNYTKYSNPNFSNRPKKETVEKKEIVREPVTEVESVKEAFVESKPAESTNYEAPTNVTTKTGTVYNCSRLNVRKEPRKDAEIMTQIPKSTVVEIDYDKSTNLFYKISISSGIKGFCMRDYISVD